MMSLIIEIYLWNNNVTFSVCFFIYHSKTSAWMRVSYLCNLFRIKVLLSCTSYVSIQHLAWMPDGLWDNINGSWPWRPFSQSAPVQLLKAIRSGWISWGTPEEECQLNWIIFSPLPQGKLLFARHPTLNQLCVTSQYHEEVIK